MEPVRDTTLPPRPAMSHVVLNIGFVAGLVLALGCLALSAIYLLRFQAHAGSAVSSVMELLARGESADSDIIAMQAAFSTHAYMARVLLLSCGVFVGMAFGFLGFSLFLIGAEGAIDAQGKMGSASLNVTRLAPGAFVILCSAILIGICVTSDLPVSFTAETSEPVAGGESSSDDATDQPTNDAPDEVDSRSPDEAASPPPS